MGFQVGKDKLVFFLLNQKLIDDRVWALKAKNQTTTTTKEIQHSVLPVSLEGNRRHAPLQDREGCPWTSCIGYSAHGSALWVSIFPVVGKTIGNGWNERIFLMGWMHHQSHWPENMTGVWYLMGPSLYRSMATLPFHSHHSSRVQLNLPLPGLFFPKDFPAEEVNESLITLFFLRFRYDLIVIYLHELISHRDLSLINCYILLTVSCWPVQNSSGFLIHSEPRRSCYLYSGHCL